MHRGAWVGVALALVIAVSQGARGQALCVEDLDVRASPRDADAGLRFPERPPRRASSKKIPPKNVIRVERTAGSVALNGRNEAVHGGYFGCGERIHLGGADERARLSYARSQDWDLWRRLDGDPFAAEHFFDAEIKAPDGGAFEAGYALNMYAAEGQASPFSDRRTMRSVTGSAFWLSGLDNRIQLKSSLGMDEPTIEGAMPLAHRHEVDIEPLRFGDEGAIFASLSYAEADAGFAAGRGAYVPADARVWSIGAGVRSDLVGLRIDHRRGRDNLGENEWQVTRSYDEWIGRVDLDAPIGGFLIPDLISFRGSVRSDHEDYDDGFAIDPQRHATTGWGINMLWRDDGAFAGVDFSGRMADASALENAGILPSQRLGLSVGGELGDVRLSSRLYSERQILAAGLDDASAIDYGGALAAALFGQRLEGSLAYGRTATNGFAPAMRWGLAAELNWAELKGEESLRVLGEDVFALGRLESHYAEDATGWQADYTAKLVAGFRF